MTLNKKDLEEIKGLCIGVGVGCSKCVGKKLCDAISVLAENLEDAWDELYTLRYRKEELEDPEE